MAKLSRDFSTDTLHLRENIAGSGTLGALNAWGRLTFIGVG